MRVILVPIGSAGDVHPLIGIGTALQRRGHDVTMIVNTKFEPLVRRVGLRFVPFGTLQEFEEVTADSDLWDSRKGFETIARLIVDRTPALYQLVCDHHVPGDTVVVAAGLAFGARIAQETLGLPLATVQLQPVCVRSLYESPVFIPWLARIDLLPRPIKRALFRLIDIHIDRIVGPGTNRFRADHGLPPARRLMNDWWNSPQAIIGLFPGWFGRPQPDWPSQLTCVGFPLYDESDVTAMPPAVAAFLEGGEPPIVWTPGSAMRHGRSFFEVAIEACRRLDRRGLLLTRYPEQLPARLLDGICHADYVPLSQVLRRSAALVHHGGIGTLAQGLAAGVPQLVMPMAHDQPDNAIRLRRLGCGVAVKPSAFRAPAVTEALHSLLTSPDVARSCQQAAERIAADRPLDLACDIVERLLDHPQPRTVGLRHKD